MKLYNIVGKERSCKLYIMFGLVLQKDYQLQHQQHTKTINKPKSYKTPSTYHTKIEVTVYVVYVLTMYVGKGETYNIRNKQQTENIIDRE